MTRIRNIALTVLVVTAAIFAVWYVGNTLYHHYHHSRPTGSGITYSYPPAQR